jgi:hypothetical protein
MLDRCRCFLCDITLPFLRSHPPHLLGLRIVYVASAFEQTAKRKPRCWLCKTAGGSSRRGGLS